MARRHGVAAGIVLERVDAGVVAAGGQDAFDAEVQAFAAVVVERRLFAGGGVQPAHGIRGARRLEGRDAEGCYIPVPVVAPGGRVDLAVAAVLGDRRYVRQRRLGGIQHVQAHFLLVASHFHDVAAGAQEGVDAEVEAGAAVVVLGESLSGGVFQYADRVEAAGCAQGDGGIGLDLESPAIHFVRRCDRAHRALVPSHCRQCADGQGRVLDAERIVAEAIFGTGDANVVGAGFDVPFDAEVAPSATVVVRCERPALLVFESADGVGVPRRLCYQRAIRGDGNAPVVDVASLVERGCDGAASGDRPRRGWQIMLPVATAGAGVQSGTDPRIEVRERAVVVAVVAGGANGPFAQRADHEAVPKDGGAAAAAFGHALLPRHLDRAGNAVGSPFAGHVAGGVFLHLASRMVNGDYRVVRLGDFRVPAGEVDAGRQPPAELQQGRIVLGACGDELRTASSGCDADVGRFRAAAGQLVEPGRLHRAGHLGGGDAVVRGEEVGDERVLVAIVQEGAGTQRGPLRRFEVDPRHGVFQAARKLANAALDVHMELGAVQGLEALGVRIQEAMGDCFHAQPGSIHRSARRQRDFDADDVASGGRRPVHLGLRCRGFQVRRRDHRKRLSVAVRMEETQLRARRQFALHGHADGSGLGRVDQHRGRPGALVHRHPV